MRGEDVVRGADVAFVVEIELAVKHFGVGLVADAEEEAADGERCPLLAVVDVAEPEALDVLLFDAEDFFDDGVGAQLDVGMSHGALEHDFARRGRLRGDGGA